MTYLSYIPVNGNRALARRQAKARKEKRENKIVAAVYILGAILLAVIITQNVIISTAKVSESEAGSGYTLELAGHIYHYE